MLCGRVDSDQRVLRNNRVPLLLDGLPDKQIATVTVGPDQHAEVFRLHELLESVRTKTRAAARISVVPFIALLRVCSAHLLKRSLASARPVDVDFISTGLLIALIFAMLIPPFGNPP